MLFAVPCLSCSAQVATTIPSMSILLQAVTAAGVGGPLGDASTRWTILAPTNDAFEDLLEDLNITAAQLLASKALLVQVRRQFMEVPYYSCCGSVCSVAMWTPGGVVSMYIWIMQGCSLIFETQSAQQQSALHLHLHGKSGSTSTACPV